MNEYDNTINCCVVCNRPTKPLQEDRDIYVCSGNCCSKVLLHTKVVHSEPWGDYLQCGKCHQITPGEKWYSSYYSGWGVVICPECGGLTYYEEIE